MLKPSYLTGEKGRLFVQQFLPDSKASSVAALLVPPFAEELNKSRRMLALLGQSLSQSGISVALPDLYGTGDSGGDFADADWDVWKQDLGRVTDMLRDAGAQRIVMIGLRMGCLLAADAWRHHQLPIQQMIFWQPILSGKQMMNQFLRLRVALGMMSGRPERVSDLRQQAQEQGGVEIAGYYLSQSLMQSLDQLEMSALLNEGPLPLHWFEVQSRADQSLPIPVQKLQKTLRSKGFDLTADEIVGDAFWTTQEITKLPELIRHSTQSVQKTL